MRDAAHGYSSAYADADDEGVTMPPKRRDSRKQRRKGSVGSGVSAADVITSPRAPPDGLWARAASFDHSYRETSLRQTPKRAPRPPPLEPPPEPVHDHGDFDDAAPTPAIPSGPRRATHQAPPVLPDPPETPRKGPSRQNSVKSSRTFRKAKTASAQESSIKDQARQFVTVANSMRGVQSSIVPVVASAAPGPAVGTLRKPYQPAAAVPAAPKEKPGFFRRVFGGSSKHQTADDNVRPEECVPCYFGPPPDTAVTPPWV